MLAPLTDAEWPAEIAEMRDGFAGSLNVYRVMANHPALLRAWTDLRDHVVVRTSLGRERSEIVILRTGHRLDSAYEWAHHVARGREIGMTDARIESVRGPLRAMTDEDALLTAAVDALLANAVIPASLVRPLEALVGREGLLDLMATVGFYSTLAFMLKTFEVEIDAAVIETQR